MIAHLKRCFQQGYFAGFGGLPTSACDYRSGTESSEAWFNGYQLGRDKRRGTK